MTAAPTQRRWLILGLLLGITIINFIDRQTLSVLGLTRQEHVRFFSRIPEHSLSRPHELLPHNWKPPASSTQG
jgi:hypothetical protein